MTKITKYLQNIEDCSGEELNDIQAAILCLNVASQVEFSCTKAKQSLGINATHYILKFSRNLIQLNNVWKILLRNSEENQRYIYHLNGLLSKIEDQYSLLP